MSKNKWYVVLGLILMVSLASAFVPISMRMRGLNPSLVGIVDDEYSDLFYNPAFINKIEGTRIYSNLSNVQGEGEDMFFSGYDYYPERYANLLGGITSYNDMKLGAMIELSGGNLEVQENGHAKEIDGNEIHLDSMNYNYQYNETDNWLHLFWGKPLSSLNIGVWFGPHWINYEERENYQEKGFYYRNDSLINYYYEGSEYYYQGKTFAYPFMVGVMKGSDENELSANFTFGFDRTGTGGPVNELEGEILHNLNQNLSVINEDFHKWESKYEQGGYFLALNGRSKKRCETHSLSFLAGISMVNQPIKSTYLDTTYELFSPVSGLKEIEISRAYSSGEGPMKYFTLSLGVGVEKYFDMMNKKTLFAIGLLPAYNNGTTTMKIKPTQIHNYYYNNLVDTLEYTTDINAIQELEVKTKFGGLSLSVPLGLETYLTDRFVFRLGVTHDLTLMFKNSFESNFADYGDSITYHQTLPNDTTIITRLTEDYHEYYKNEIKSKLSNSTQYYYGAGYKINDNIELNFTNFARLTNLQAWLLGINIKW